MQVHTLACCIQVPILARQPKLISLNFSAAQFPKRDPTRAGHFTVVPSREERVAISLNGETLLRHQLPVTRAEQDDQLQQTVEQ